MANMYRPETWGVTMTPERMRVYDAMNAEDEGLGPRAYMVLLQIADLVPVKATDAEWITDGVEQPQLARMEDGTIWLTAFGRLLASAANRGDVEMMFALTTMPELIEALGEV